MASEVFNSSGSMGTMPKRVIMQAEYFWAQDNAAVTGPESQIGTTLSGMAQGLLHAATETVGAAARLINRFRRWTPSPFNKSQESEDLSGNLSSPPSSPLLTARFIENLNDVAYPEGIKGPTALLRATAVIRPLQGITVGNIGPKASGGMAAQDQGFTRFDHVRIPRMNMFSKFAEVTTEGNYIQPPHELGNVTQIIVAHRLQMIIDADKIMVLDAGKLVDFSSPLELLQNEQGMLHALVKESGDKEALYTAAHGKLLEGERLDARFRYDRDFLLQFMHICKLKLPTLLPTLSVLVLNPSIKLRLPWPAVALGAIPTPLSSPMGGVHPHPSVNALLARICSLLHHFRPDNGELIEPRQPLRPSVFHSLAPLARLSSFIPSSPPENDAPSTSSRLDPPELHPTTPLSSHPDALRVISRLTSFFHSQTHISDELELSQPTMHPHIVEVPAMRDREVLFVAEPLPKKRAHTQPTGNTLPGARPAHSPPIRIWLILDLFCAARPISSKRVSMGLHMVASPSGTSTGM
ncbi:hypothetical protein BDR06DRAFT_1006325 [Suillus hirtellus]|nr:hypothetical protein BDR06DRAFT_1006325 [Suillus hirtellus]